jgi:hypothetical protein
MKDVLRQPERNPRNPDLRPSEDDLARERLGPRGVPGGPAAPMTPVRDKKTPVGKTPLDDGIPPEHPA